MTSPRPARPRRDPGSSVQARAAALERRLAERVLEDEALRRDLDDEQWLAIQDWLLARVQGVARAAASKPAAAGEREVEAAWERLRQAARDVGYDLAAEGGGATAEAIDRRLQRAYEAGAST